MNKNHKVDLKKNLIAIKNSNPIVVIKNFYRYASVYATLGALIFSGVIIIPVVIFERATEVAVIGILLFVFHWFWSRYYPDWDNTIKSLNKNATSLRIRLIAFIYCLQIVYMTAGFVSWTQGWVASNTMEFIAFFVSMMVLFIFTIILWPLIVMFVAFRILSILLAPFKTANWYNTVIVGIAFAVASMSFAVIGYYDDLVYPKYQQELVFIGRVISGFLPLVMINALFRGSKKPEDYVLE